ncbi:MAG: hypothetical protein CMQ16_04340 [Gammaproteobacteria bacterium]|nr:hypothetical protein [Gammaproteobacteria bacterium]
MRHHETVLQQEAVSALNVRPDGRYVDATFGRGGHARAILDTLGAEGSLLALDRDPEAIAAAQELMAQDPRVHAMKTPFGTLGSALSKMRLLGKVDGILFDLGVSSPQLDNPERGFSFMRDGPLDMRMDSEAKLSAAEWLADAPEKKIADVIYQLGEERYSRRIARAIVKVRTDMAITRTSQLADIVKQAHPAWEKHKHPATRTFQAIRMHINNELSELESALEVVLSSLATGGRLVVISFHSLEDRMVKKFMARCAKGDAFPRGVPVTAEQLKPALKLIGRPMRPTADEVQVNSRARSAVMRTAEKLEIEPPVAL